VARSFVGLSFAGAPPELRMADIGLALPAAGMDEMVVAGSQGQ
jgi:hypothetical protein